MISNQSAKQDIERLGNLKLLVETYEAISATSMRRIRDLVLKNRAFHEGLTRIFDEVAGAYRDEMLKLMRRRKIPSQAKLSLIKRNGKTVFVLTSANASLYGEVINKTFRAFLEKFRQNASDVVVIGKLGQQFMENALPKVSYVPLAFPDDRMDPIALQKIIAHISAYEHVVIFHGRFDTFLSQEVVATAIPGDEPKPETVSPSASSDAPHARYFFEPSLETITIFFETQIFNSLVAQSLQESRLAKLASRMMLLDRASGSIDQAHKRARFEKQKFEHQVFNKKQFNALGTVFLWERAR